MEEKFASGDILNAGTDYNYLVCKTPIQFGDHYRYSILELIIRPSRILGEEECWRIYGPSFPVHYMAEKTYQKIGHVNLPEEFNWSEDVKKIEELAPYMRAIFD